MYSDDVLRVAVQPRVHHQDEFVQQRQVRRAGERRLTSTHHRAKKKHEERRECEAFERNKRLRTERFWPVGSDGEGGRERERA